MANLPASGPGSPALPSLDIDSGAKNSTASGKLDPPAAGDSKPADNAKADASDQMKTNEAEEKAKSGGAASCYRTVA